MADRSCWRPARRSVELALVVGAALGLVCLLNWATLEPGRAGMECCPSKTMTSVDLTRVSNVHSADLRAVGALAGQIELYEKGFVPLKLDRIELLLTTAGDEQRAANGTPPLNGHIRLSAACALLTVAFSMDETTTRLTGFQWSLADEVGPERTCAPLPDNGPIAFNNTHRYSCLGLKLFTCKRPQRDGHGSVYQRPVGALQLQLLELELFGKKLAAFENKFSKPPQPGC
jgi:hypothetical protein